MSKAGEKQVVLITGCSIGGIGAGLCEEFAERGWTVYATARKLESMQGFVHKEIKTVTLDVTSETNVEDVVKNIIADEGKIDIVVSNAGMICIGACLDVPQSQVEATFDTNVYGTLRLARAVVPHMAKAKKGTLVVIGSVTSDIPTPWNGIYCATKSALQSISEVLMMECEPLGIKVLHVNPGAVTSNISQNQSKVFRVPEQSLWKNYVDKMIERMHVSQRPGKSMPNAEFAKLVVGEATKAEPRQFLRVGGQTWMISLGVWLPRSLQLGLMWKMMGRK